MLREVGWCGVAWASSARRALAPAVVVALSLPLTAAAQPQADGPRPQTEASPPEVDPGEPQLDGKQTGLDASESKANRHKSKADRHNSRARHHKRKAHRNVSKDHHRKRKTTRRRAEYPRWNLGLSAETSSGVIRGQRTLDEDALFAETEVKVTPSVDVNRPWRFALPTQARYRHTWLTPLREAAGEIDAKVAYAPLRPWEFELGAGVDAIYRPDWPDQYQIDTDGSLGSTDRFSYWTRHAGTSVRWGSFKRLRLELAYEFALFDYINDPAYDPSEEPTHLVPGDRLEHSAELDVHRRWGILSIKPGFGATYKHYFNAYARDARTGLTHAGVGGEPENPLLRLWSLEPELRVEVEAVEDTLNIKGGYAHVVGIDVFEGYYSYHAPKPSLGVEVVPLPALTLDLELSAQFWRYGKDSYAEGGSHPALEEGARRRERVLEASLDLTYELSNHWAVFAAGKWLRKDSNMPDYVPGVYPESRQYSIDWDYTNLVASAGVRFTL